MGFLAHGLYFFFQGVQFLFGFHCEKLLFQLFLLFFERGQLFVQRLSFRLQRGKLLFIEHDPLMVYGQRYAEKGDRLPLVIPIL